MSVAVVSRPATIATLIDAVVGMRRPGDDPGR
jgi:hypothetical protein